MIEFALAVFFLIATPGPGVLTTAGVGSAFGYGPGLRFLTGLFIGTNLVAIAVVTGLAGIMLSTPGLREVFLVGSAAYLAWLALKIAMAGAKISFITTDAPPGLVGGVLLQAINPKAYAVNTTLFSGFAMAGMSLTAEMVAKFLIMNAIWIPLHVVWLWAGVSLRRLDLPAATQRWINRAMAAALLAVVALALGGLTGAFAGA